MADLKDRKALNEKSESSDGRKNAEVGKRLGHSDSRSSSRNPSRSSSSDSGSRGKGDAQRDSRSSHGNSRSCSRDRRSRSRSPSKKRHRDSAERHEHGLTSIKKHEHRSSHDSKTTSRHKSDDDHGHHGSKRSRERDSHRSSHRRSRSRDRRRRSSSREKQRRSRSRSHERKRSRSHERKRSRSHSKERRHRRSRSHEKSTRRRSRSRSYEPVRKRSLLSESKGIVKQALLLGGEVPAKALVEIATETASSLPLNPSIMVGQMTPQLAVQQAMAAMSARAQELTGIALPKYYNPAAVNPLKYAEQMQKRKLLWNANKEKPECTATHSMNNWESTTFAQDQDGKMTAKFRKLMGIKEGGNEKGDEASGSEDRGEDESPPKTTPPSDDLMRKQDELFRSLDQQYEIARMSTHTHRGVGLGFSSQAHHMFPK